RVTRLEPIEFRDGIPDWATAHWELTRLGVTLRLLSGRLESRLRIRNFEPVSCTYSYSDPIQVVEIPLLGQGGVARSAGVVRNGDSTNQHRES
ncbi:MAG TPA: hypothetical protein P5326_12795, partial [Candidatus Contendobacter sp.]|nr:hypothetical protein [Candidatus Contendobacter sp.]